MGAFYSNEAKQRVAEAGTTAITDFIESIPPGARQKILSNLPKVPGFRTGSQAELKERYKRLLNTLTHPTDPRFRYDGKEWMAFANLWAYWAEHCFENSVNVDAKPPGEYDGDATYKFFETLVEKCGENGCPKEDALKLYQFSGFPNNPRVDALLSNLPTRRIVEQRRRFAGLPTEVEKLRSQIELIETGYHSLKNELSTITADFSLQLKSKRQGGGELEALGKEVGVLKSDFDSTTSRFNKQVQSVLSDVEALKRAISLHDSHFVSVDAERKKLFEEQATMAKLISQGERANKDLKASVEKQLEKIKVDEPNNANGTRDPTPSQVTRTKHTGSNVQKAQTLDIALSQISNNLVAVGVQPEDAENAAVIVLVAALSGQLLQVSGSLADVFVAGACHAIGGDDYVEWDVPLGLCDSEQTSAVLAFFDNEKRPNCLVIRGMNKSAFEIYGNGLRHLVVSSQIGLRNETQTWPLFATIADGPTTLPSGPEIVSLGPVLDTDKLTWYRAKPEKRKLGTLASTAILSEIKQNTDVDDLGDVVNDIQNVGFNSNQMRKQVLQKATSILLGASRGDAKKAFENLVAYWILPWEKVNGATRSEAATRIRKYSPGSQETPMIAKALAELQEEAN